MTSDEAIAKAIDGAMDDLTRLTAERDEARAELDKARQQVDPRLSLLSAMREAGIVVLP